MTILKDDILVLKGWSCPYCGSPTRLVDSSIIYGSSYNMQCYYCSDCNAWVGCHKGTDKSLGRIANKSLRLLKRQAHEVFDKIWLNGYMSRKDAYNELSKRLGLSLEFTHIGMFDEDMCKQVIKHSKELLNEIKVSKC